MMRIIAIPFGWILKLCYLLVKNYGIALLLFTLVIKLIMLPSSIKQQKASAKTARLQPKLEQIRKKYANNKDKLNEATMELYNQEGVSMGGSCLPMIVTYVILFAIIEVVYAPLSYISSIPKDKIDSAVQTVADLYRVSSAVKADVTADRPQGWTISQRLEQGITVEELLGKLNTSVEESVDEETGEKTEARVGLGYSEERLTELVKMFEENPGLDEYFNDSTKVSPRLLAGGNTTRAQLIVLSAANDYPQLFDSEVSDFCDDFDYTFLGFYLGGYPSWKNIYVLIPILSFVSQIALTFLSQFFMKRNGQNVSQGKGMMTMLYLMPLLSFWIAFSFPAGIGIYWIYSSLTAILQTVFMNLYYTPARLEVILAKEAKKKSRKPSLYQLALEQQKAQQGSTGKSLLDDLDEPEVKLTKNERKEIERQKINDARKRLVDDEEDVDPRVLEARKRMAEKYGE